MTIDSRYEPERQTTDSEVEYQFTFESIGEEAVRVYLITEQGERILLRRIETLYVEY